MKKNTFCILLMIFSLQLQAQLTNGTYTQEIDERIKNLNKSNITSNILINRVFSFAKIDEFNQGTRIDTSSYIHFKQAWSELYRASYSKNFASLAQLNVQLKNKAYQKNEIPIGIINTEFHEFNFGTTTANANVGYNEGTGLFYNISGKNPFAKKQTTIIAPLVSVATGTTISFTTDNLFTLYKHGKQIKTLQLITNSSTFTLISNYNLISGNFTTNYNTSGVKDLRFNITYSDNTTKTTYARVVVNVPQQYYARANTYTSPLEPIEADDDLAFIGYEAGDQPIKGKNEYRIYYSDASKTIDKPLYIIDGYDPGDTRKIEEFDEGHNEDEKSIVELMSYDPDNNIETNNNISLIDSLNIKGYDVIIINHVVNPDNGIDGGSDYIERNAYTFISLLRKIKDMQQGNEKAVVIGPSMGGLISRYALTYMEKKYAETGLEKWNHNTRLWVSFDSPHQGANIPIGVQKGIQYFADVLEVPAAEKFIDEQLNKPATKQMLVNHYTNDTNLPVGAPNYRNHFQTTLDNLGMPQNLRKVALINGSIMGALNGTSEAKYLQVNSRVPFLGGISPIISNHFFHNTNRKNGNQNYLTFKGNGLYLHFLLFRIPIIKERKNYSTPINKGSYDIAPGAYFNAQGLLANESNTDSYWTINGVKLFHSLSTRSITYDSTHSFIPTKSALAYTGSNVLDEVIGFKNRVCTGETPFDNYFAPQENEEHITLTTANVAWLKDELDITTSEPLPTVYLTENDLQGATRICQNTTEVYAFSNCQFTATNWQISNNLTKVWSNSTHIAVKPKTGVNYGAALITAVNGDASVTKQVNLGYHLFTTITEIPAATIQHLLPTAPLGNTDIGLQLNFNASNTEIENIEWQKTSNNFIWSQDNNLYGNDNRVIVSKNCNGPIEFKVRVKNSCGWSNWQDIIYNITSCATNCSNAGNTNTTGVNSTNFEVYPVPSSVNLTVKIKNQPPAILQNGEFFIVTLYNKVFRIKREVNGVAIAITVQHPICQ